MTGPKLCKEVYDVKVMVVGGGGREHAIIRKIKENPEVTDEEGNSEEADGGQAQEEVPAETAAPAR